MKEARIDEVLETIAMTCLVFLPNEPIAPSEFLQENIKYGQEISKDHPYRLLLTSPSTKFHYL